MSRSIKINRQKMFTLLLLLLFTDLIKREKKNHPSNSTVFTNFTRLQLSFFNLCYYATNQLLIAITSLFPNKILFTLFCFSFGPNCFFSPIVRF